MDTEFYDTEWTDMLAIIILYSFVYSHRVLEPGLLTQGLKFLLATVKTIVFPMTLYSDSLYWYIQTPYSGPDLVNWTSILYKYEGFRYTQQFCEYLLKWMFQCCLVFTTGQALVLSQFCLKSSQRSLLVLVSHEINPVHTLRQPSAVN